MTMAGDSIVPLLLKNGGDDRNLCSLNSIIQFLHSIPEFHKDLSEFADATPIIKEIQFILSNAGSNIPISALELRRLLALESRSPLLNSGAQHDTVELLGYLLDYIPSQLFKFKLQYEYRFKIDNQPCGCPDCGQFPSPVSVPQKILKLSLPPTTTRNTIKLEQLFNNHFSIQPQSEGRRCSNCHDGPQIPYYEKCKVAIYPAYLLVQILRMKHTSEGITKNLCPVELLRTKNIQVNEQFYNVIGTISHIGTADAGHNRAYLKTGPTWYCCEDYRLPFQKDPIDTDHEQNYCIILRKSQSNNEAQPTTSQHLKPPTPSEKPTMSDQPSTSQQSKPSTASEKPTLLGQPTTSKRTTTSQQSSKSQQKGPNESIENLKQNLKRLHSTDSTDSTEYSKTVCLGCGKNFTRLLGHIRQTECSKSYDMEKLEQEVEMDKKIKQQQYKQKYKEKQITLAGSEENLRERQSKERQQRRVQKIITDPEAYNNMRAEEKAKERSLKQNTDPEAYKNMRAAEKAKERSQKQNTDPKAYNNMRAAEKAKERSQKQNTDPEAYNNMRAAEKAKERSQKQTTDPEAYHSEMAKEKAKQRDQKQTNDPEAYHSEMANEKAKQRDQKQTNDPDAFKEKERDERKTKRK